MASQNLIKLPGLVDIHVHLREPGGTHKEDFETGTQAAIAGGYTQILDMPNNIPSTVSPRSLRQKIKLAKRRIYCDVGFNFGATVQSAKYFKNIASKTFGLKVYMNQTTGPLLIEKLKDRDLIFKSWPGHLPIMVHAEGETVEIAIRLAKKYSKKLHVCHVTYDQIKAIENARKNGINITCEVCPHHLFLNLNDLRKLGPLAVMKPPLLSKHDQQRLWDKLDKIDIIATDHAPHTLEEKYEKSGLKFGVPGLETTLPLMLNAVSKKLISIDRLIEMTSINPRRIFHLPKQPNTYIIVDFAKTFKISQEKLFTKCHWTPFVGIQGRGEVKKVVIRKKTVFAKGKFIRPPSGQIIFPKEFKPPPILPDSL